MTKICAYVDKVNLDAFVCLFYDGVFYFTLVSNIKRFFLKIECQEISERQLNIYNFMFIKQKIYYFFTAFESLLYSKLNYVCLRAVWAFLLIQIIQSNHLAGVALLYLSILTEDQRVFNFTKHILHLHILLLWPKQLAELATNKTNIVE